MRKNSGMTLLEIIIVIGLMAMIYAVAMPQFNLKSGVELSTKLGQIATDIRSAADLALLTKKSYRIVFMLESGQYWLESTEKQNFYLGNDLVSKDPTEEEEQLEIEDTNYKFQKYEDLTEKEYTDPDSGDKVQPVSIVLAAKDKLSPPVWRKVENLEWSTRELGSYFVISDASSSRFNAPIQRSSAGEQDRFIIYFLESGYIDDAVMHIALKDDPDNRDSTYTIRVKPYEGTAEALTGYYEKDSTLD